MGVFRVLLSIVVVAFAALIALDSSSRGFQEFDIFDPYKPRLRIHYKFFITLFNLVSRTRLSRDTVVEIRARRERLTAAPTSPIARFFDLQGDVFTDVNVTDTTIEGVPVRIYVPKLSRELRSGQLLYFHGGGFVLGSLNTHDRVCRRLSVGLRRKVVSVNYRKAPEFPFPAAVEDCLRVARAVFSEGQPTAVMGDSAGANLAAVVARNFALEKRALVGQVLVYPVTDFVQSYPSHTRYGVGYLLEKRDLDAFYDMYFSDAAQRSHPNASIVSASVPSNLARAFVVVAETDPLADETVAYAKLMQRNNVPVETLHVEGVPHAFFNFQKLEEAQMALNATVRWLDSVFLK